MNKEKNLQAELVPCQVEVPSYPWKKLWDHWGFPGSAGLKNSPTSAETQDMQLYPWVRKIPWSG